MMVLLKKLVRDEEGATAIEYGLIASLIAVAIIAAVTSTGTSLKNVFGKVTTSISAAP